MADESPRESPPAAGELVVPSHGKGKIRRGSKPGNTPGSGRTPSALRKMALKKGPKMLQVLATIADNESAKDSDRVAAAREMLRVGMGNAMSKDEVRDKLQATIMAAESMLPEELAMRFIFEVRKIWLGR